MWDVCGGVCGSFEFGIIILWVIVLASVCFELLDLSVLRLVV